VFCLLTWSGWAHMVWMSTQLQTCTGIVTAIKSNRKGKFGSHLINASWQACEVGVVHTYRAVVKNSCCYFCLSKEVGSTGRTSSKCVHENTLHSSTCMWSSCESLSFLAETYGKQQREYNLSMQLESQKQRDQILQSQRVCATTIDQQHQESWHNKHFVNV